MLHSVCVVVCVQCYGAGAVVSELCRYTHCVCGVLLVLPFAESSVQALQCLVRDRRNRAEHGHWE